MDKSIRDQLKNEAININRIKKNNVENNVNRLFRAQQPIYNANQSNEGLPELKPILDEFKETQVLIEKIRNEKNETGLLKLCRGFYKSLKTGLGFRDIKREVEELFDKQYETVGQLNESLVEYIRHHENDVNYIKTRLNNLLQEYKETAIRHKTLEEIIPKVLKNYDIADKKLLDTNENLEKIESTEEISKIENNMQLENLDIEPDTYINFLDAKRTLEELQSDYILTIKTLKHKGDQIINLTLQETIFNGMMSSIKEMAVSTKLYKETLYDNTVTLKASKSLLGAIESLDYSLNSLYEIHEEVNNNFAQYNKSIQEITSDKKKESLIKNSNLGLKRIKNQYERLRYLSTKNESNR